MTPRHEQAPIQSPELSANEKALYDMASLIEWRAVQHKAIDDLLVIDGELNYETDKKFEEAFESLLDDYLKSKGLDSESANYTEVKTLYADASINKINDDKWSNKPSHRGEIVPGDRSHSEVFAERLAERVGFDVETEGVDEPGDTPEEERRIERLEELKKAKHEAYAKRMTGRRYGKKAKQNREAYDLAEAAYSEALLDDISRQLDDKLGAEIDDAQRQDAIKDIGENLLKEDDEKQYETLIEKGGIKARLLAKYEKLSRAQKFGLGALAAVGGVGAGFAAGAVGAATAGVIAGVGAYRYTYNKFFAESGIYRKPSHGDSGLFAYDPASSVAPEKQIVSALNTRSRHNIERADQVKERAVRIGIGAAAVGGTLALAGGAFGTFLHTSEIPTPGNLPNVGLDDGHWAGGYIEHLFDNDASAHTDSGTEGASVDERESALGSDEGIDGEEARDLGADLGLEDRDAGSAPEVDDQPEFEVPEYVVSSGEGFFTTFENLGVDEANRLELLKDIGPQLEEMGVAYRMPDGLWGISAPGELPHEAVELIMSSASENGWLIDSAPSAEVYGVNEPFAVESEHGYTHELIDAAAAQGTDMTPEQAWAAHTTIVDAVGSDYIDLHDVNGADTYSMGASAYETGIASPSGDATWSAEAQPLIADAIDDGVINGSVDISDISPAEVAETTAAEPANEVITTTDDTGVDVDDESLNPSEAYDDAGVEAQLTAVEKAFANERISDLIDSGNYQLLNQFDAPGVDISQLAEQFAGMNYSDGTPLVEPASGGGMQFNEQPDGARLPNQAIDRINSFLEQAGLETYSYDKFNQAAAASAGRP